MLPNRGIDLIQRSQSIREIEGLSTVGELSRIWFADYWERALSLIKPRSSQETKESQAVRCGHRETPTELFVRSSSFIEVHLCL